MLLNLDIKNAALIEHLTLELNEGMTVLTGETGAGKSVIIDSINMILGARTSKNLVRYGEKKAVIQAMFYSEDVSWLEEIGIPSEDNIIIVSREVSCDGRSVCRINGMMTPQNIVREITQRLINIHGQHDSQALLNPSRHIDFLDSYAKNGKLLSEYTEIYNEKIKIEEDIASLEMDEAEKMRRIDLLTYQVDEIKKACIKPGEKKELLEQRALIQNGEKISVSLNGSYDLLYNEENSAYDRISNAAGLLMKISGIDERFENIYQRVNDIQYALDDISHEIYDIASEIDYDEQSLNEIEARLDCIGRIERKYGGSEEAAAEFLKRAEAELEQITDSETEKKRLSQKLSEIMKKIKKAADKLTESRQEAGRELSREIERELSELDMPKVKFSAAVEISGYTKNGADKVEFLISPNPGEPLKPLEKIASGGELSRVMLAMKSILSDSDKVDTLIFDEIDTGVSGSAAKKIAQKLFKLAEKKQIICVSHQPQLAAAADNHYNIKKTELENRTVTTAELLDADSRVCEIARIIDGDNITQASLEHARQMLAQYMRKR